MVFEDNIRV